MKEFYMTTESVKAIYPFPIAVCKKCEPKKYTFIAYKNIELLSGVVMVAELHDPATKISVGVLKPNETIEKVLARLGLTFNSTI